MIDYKINNLPELLEFDNTDIDKFKSTELLVKEQIKLLEEKAQEYQCDNYELRTELQEKNKLLEEFSIKETDEV